MYKIMDGNEACSYVSYNFTELAGIYPITPASPMAEVVDKESSSRKNFFGNPVKVIEMQSEAGAAGLVHGSLLSGVLTTTYTASQGLLLMIPNMYKIAGEGLPLVIHVASRSLATHALSIMGDHQDIYATRQTGFAMLANSSPQEVMDLTSVAHLSAIKGHIPFLNFFDGFRTSHELNKVELIDLDKVYKLIDFKELERFRNRGLNIDKPNTFGTCQMDDVYFQVAEARNKKYESFPDIVNDYMSKINEITGKKYKPFNYYGAADAENIIVAMGSVCETIKETIDYLNSQGLNYGLIEVHLYRPFSSKYLLKVLPSSVKRIAVLDRTKENGGNCPLYLDVLSVINDANLNIKVYGGRYGLSGKDTNPAHIKAVFDYLSGDQLFNNFTIGINDDVTKLSLKTRKFVIPSKNYEMLIYGFGSDGMVSASKDIIKITGNGSNAFVQGYFEYDSKKSGGVTISHLRFGKKPIKSSYYVSNSNTLIVTKDSYLKKYDIISSIKEDGIFILNTDRSDPLELLTNRDKEYLYKNRIKMYVIDANKIANDVELPGKISAIMEVLIFKLCHIIDYKYAKEEIKISLENKFKNKGNNILEKNLKAIELINKNYKEIELSRKDIGEIEEENENMTLFDVLESRMGGRVPVSSFLSSIDGMTPPITSSFERRYTSNIAPRYTKENCISCNMCSFVCPHGVIRPYLLSNEEYENAPNYVRERCIETSIKSKLYKFTIAMNIANCTGCGICVNTCPGKKGMKALEIEDSKILLSEKEQKRFEYLEKNIKDKDVLDKFTIKGSQLIKPKFAYPGACSGCGETSYLKLVSQLFGDNLVVANATGCSSIYSASYPITTYNTPWANSLFEDNAEFGMGMVVADLTMKNNLKNILKERLKDCDDNESEIFDNYLADESSYQELYDYVVESKDKELSIYKNFIKPKTFFIIGGDGWAYDIGFSGIDHVLSNNYNVNILVLDTEVYSNTGGQSSKSSRIGSVSKFAASGKKTNKKDLASIAMTYKNAYVGTISLGANMNQAIKVLKEAVEYNGPSIIIAYAPCIAHGILKGMSNTMEEEKLAVESGYFPLYRFNPLEGLTLDSKADFDKYYEFIAGEDRYRTLKNINPKEYKELLEKNMEYSKNRFEELNDKGE